jgi:hypothetical protein
MTSISSDTLCLASQNCTFCFGRGARSRRNGASSVCPCVFRYIFRVCYARFIVCSDKEKHMSSVSLTRIPGPRRGATFARKDEEFMADFILIGRRTLDEVEQRVFKAHLLLGADWKLCCRQLRMDKGTFFHLVYRVMQKLGKAFAETKPYALFPIADYYESHCGVDLPGIPNSTTEIRRRDERIRIQQHRMKQEEERNRRQKDADPRPIVPPVRKAA